MISRVNIGRRRRSQNKGPTPFGVEPSASAFAMLVLFVHNVSIVHHSFPARLLKHLHATASRALRLPGEAPAEYGVGAVLMVVGFSRQLTIW